MRERENSSEMRKYIHCLVSHHTKERMQIIRRNNLWKYDVLGKSESTLGVETEGNSDKHRIGKVNVSKEISSGQLLLCLGSWSPQQDIL